jgi:hypothetical protein
MNHALGRAQQYWPPFAVDAAKAVFVKRFAANEAFVLNRTVGRCRGWLMVIGFVHKVQRNLRARVRYAAIGPTSLIFLKSLRFIA